MLSGTFGQWAGPEEMLPARRPSVHGVLMPDDRVVMDPVSGQIAITDSTEEERAAYEAVLVEIKARWERARDLFANPNADRETVERVSLQIRKIIELLVLAPLTTNRAFLAEISEALHKRDAASARKLLKTHHPKYWPEAIQVVDGNKHHLKDVPKELVLQEHEWGRVFGECSERLHADNPLAAPSDWIEAMQNLRRRAEQIRRLLTMHWVILADRNDRLMAQISPNGVKVQAFGKLEEPPPDWDPDTTSISRD